MRPEGPAPKGLKNSAQGFNPGNAQNEWFALKGQMNFASIVAQKGDCRNCEGYNRTLLPRCKQIRSGAPAGRVAVVVSSQG